jgi:Kef-type K+ transport system membrane component KefB
MPSAFVGKGISAVTFALFIGTAMAVTAFPVLARILSDSGLGKTELGTTALACAAVADAGAWCLLAIVTGVAHSEIRLGLVVLGLTLVFLLAMLCVVRPLIVWWAKRYDESPSRGMLAAAFLALLAAALAAEAIGIHAIFGAFALGTVVPHDSRLSATLRDKLMDLVTVLLLPAFFAFAGMRTELGLVSGWQNWLWCVAIIVVATLGKLGGTMAAARWCGYDARNALSLGVLMNTRGLMELVVLNIGLDLGIITPTIFAMMVVMALVTPLATTPALAWLNRGTAING